MTGWLSRAPGLDEYAGPARIGSGWYLLVLRAGRQRPGWMATVRWPAGDGPPQAVALIRPFRLFGLKLGVFFLRGVTSQVSVRLFGADRPPGRVWLRLLPLPRLLAAVGVWLQNPAVFRTSFAAVSGPLPERVRKAAAAAAVGGQRPPGSYGDWVRLFDTWPPERLAPVQAGLRARPAVSALVLGGDGTPALTATLDSLRSQTYPLVGIDVGTRRDGVDYVAVVQAGEVLPPHAVLMLVAALETGTDIVLADEDRLGPDGARTDPWFKPQPNLTMMCSGLMSRGVWLIRAGLLSLGTAWAESVRLQAWFGSHAAHGRAVRVPYVLTHRRADCQGAPPALLAEVVDAGLRDAGIQATVAPDVPLRLQWHPGASDRRTVSLLVPSRLDGTTQLACLLDVLAKTTHPNFELLVVVTQQAPLDRVQQAAADRLRADPRARVVRLDRPSFNYSAANNHAAALTSGEFICLLNDDVSTLDGDWLERMVAVFSDPQTGIVGAKLYYPNLTTQHGGVIMGLTGLAQHASRFLPRGAPGYAWRGVLDQELSAVTGACLLVRRSIYERLGGLDETYPTAFNDVDFCLRVRELGYAVVFAGSVELVHHETLSFGHHYASAMEQEARDVRRMHERWPEVCAADPFHNPNLSLAGQAEWSLAYPPRL